MAALGPVRVGDEAVCREERLGDALAAAAAVVAAVVVAVVALDRPAVTKFMPGASSPTAAVMSAAASHLAGSRLRRTWSVWA